ncbi:hypothetical protein F5884DRAFT_81666 [Xylogone sp. PMI_703]|nr:hypothetical protein F5884DRAFT_81666 [Xylogone sp. PMI_703]
MPFDIEKGLDMASAVAKAQDPPLTYPAIPIAPSDLGTRGNILFRHPAYEPPTNILLYLPRTDRMANTNLYGIHHETALVACQIIANNEFNGLFQRISKACSGLRPLKMRY